MSAWVIGNWKLNPTTSQQALNLADDIITQSKKVSGCQMMVAPSAVHLALVANQIKDSSVAIAGQDITALTATSGAYTGDISAAQLKDIGANWVIIGHSERREYYTESNSLLLQKLQYCQQYDLGVILCIGETEEEYHTGKTQTVLRQQLYVIKEYLNTLDSLNAQEEQFKLSEKLDAQLIIAYEPVWAIGSGKVPTVEEVTHIHVYIREVLNEMKASLKSIPIIYGGSVKPENAKVFASSQEINGVLVGGAALDAKSFIAIAQAFSASI